MATKTDSTRVITGRVRLSFPHLFEPFAFEEGDKPKYSTMVLIPKSDKATMDKIRAAEEAAKAKGKESVWGGKIPSEVASVIKDGDEVSDDFPERAGHWYFTIRTNTKPGVVDQSLNPVVDASDVYSGVYARVSMSAFPYKYGGSKGVSFGLSNVQKIADGESLGGSRRAEEEFDAVEDDDDLI